MAYSEWLHGKVLNVATEVLEPVPEAWRRKREAEEQLLLHAVLRKWES